MTHFAMRWFAVRWAFAAVASSALPSGCASQGARAAGGYPNPAVSRPPGSPLDSTLAIATFDSAWSMVGTALRARGTRPANWDSLRTELRPRAARARSAAELRAVIGRMLSRLGESHFAVLPDTRGQADTGTGDAVAPRPEDASGAADAALGTAGIEPRLVGDRLVVWRVAENGPAMRSGIRPGWVIETIDGRASAPAIAIADSIVEDWPKRVARLRIVATALNELRGVPGTVVRLALRDNTSHPRTLALVREQSGAPVVRLGNLPPLAAPFELTMLPRPGRSCVAVIRFEYWMPAIMPKLDQAMSSARTCGGVVMDLRGNVGGVAGMVMGVGGHFLQEPLSLGTMRTQGQELRFVANPRRATDTGAPARPYAGPLAILIDDLTASTSEIFAVAMQSLGRARLFGVRSAGQALPAIATRLPNGDVLMHVIADFVAPDGRRIEGVGAVPDEVIPLVMPDLRAGRDAALAAALRWIGEEDPPAIREARP